MRVEKEFHMNCFSVYGFTVTKRIFLRVIEYTFVNYELHLDKILHTNPFSYPSKISITNNFVTYLRVYFFTAWNNL